MRIQYQPARTIGSDISKDVLPTHIVPMHCSAKIATSYGVKILRTQELDSGRVAVQL